MGSAYVADNTDANNIGVIPRAVEDIFNFVADNPDSEIKVGVSFMELYKEQLFDLLAPERVTVEIREDNKGIEKRKQ